MSRKYQKTEQKTENRGQRTEDRGQTTDAEDQKLGSGEVGKLGGQQACEFVS